MNEKNKKRPTPPFSLEYAEARNKIFNAVNEASQKHGVPFYLIEEILTNVSHQVKECAKVERENAQRIYEKHLAEYEKQESEGDQ